MTTKERNILINNMLFKAETLSHTSFLNPLELSACLSELKKHKNYILAGGTPLAERKAILFYSEFASEVDVYNPIKVLEITCKNKVSHRDVLGSIMGLGIKREKVGDILVSENVAVVFLLEEIFQFILQNLLKVGNEYVIIKEIPLENDFESLEDYTVITDTVKSLRLDSILSSGFKTSRSNALELIKSQRVFLNNNLCTKSCTKINPNDKISVRGKGKIIFVGESGKSRSERIFVEIKRFN